jgi:hypothetical protein
MRIVRAPLCIAVATAIYAMATSGHVTSGHAAPGRAAADSGRGIERVASDQIKSKSPCSAERPPSYCKPKKGSS